jgi:hypothetical protein
VAVDARGALLLGDGVVFACTGALRKQVHVGEAVAGAAFARIVALHLVPHGVGQDFAPLFELLRRSDGADQVVKDVTGGAYLVRKQRESPLGNVTIRAFGLHAHAILEMNGPLIFGEVAPHRVARSAELVRFRNVDDRVEADEQQRG